MASNFDCWTSDFDSDEAPGENSKPSHRLVDQIIDNFATSKFDPQEKQFLPTGYVEKLVTLEAIIKELDEKDYLEPEDLDLGQRKKEVVDFVCQKAKTVFAISVYSGVLGQGLGLTMRQFMKIGFSDDSLPITEKILEDQVIQPLSKRPGDAAAQWSKKKKLDFLMHQWSFIAPTFSGEIFKFDLTPDHILPFIEKSNRCKEGAFGQVFMVEIHPAHQINPVTNPDGSLAKLAIKEFVIPANDEKLQKDVEDVWESEVDTLDRISDLNHPHLIQRIAAIKRGKQRFLMFLWAHGGNLRDFWMENPKPVFTAAFIKDIIRQLRGMAEALQKLHEYRGQFHYRHGDLKPENVLHFPAPDKSSIGTFKISDLGSAKHHSAATRLRERTAGKAFATLVYQPPESVTNKLSPSSRLYDVWSMGCVTLELMVWIVYGYEELKNFTTSIKGKLDEPSSFFLVRQSEQEGTAQRLVAHIHPVVQNCLDHLSREPECTGKTALGDLLEIVKKKLLVIKLPEHTESSVALDNFSFTNADDNFTKPKMFQAFGKHRTSAAGFVDALDNILRCPNAKKESYWFTRRSRENIPLPRITTKIVNEESPPSSRLSPGWRPQHGPMVAMIDRTKAVPSSEHKASFMVVPGSSRNIQDRVHLSNDWAYPVDNEFAMNLVKRMGLSDVTPSAPRPSHLCGKCEKVDFWAPRLRIEDTWSELESRLSSCDFCKLKWNVSRNLNRKDYSSVSFERVGSMLRMNDKNSPALSICRSLELKTTLPIQIGFPQLSEARSDSHFKILRQWLKNCDDNHQELKCQSRNINFLPTRLINVGRKESETVRLYETQSTDSLKYLALSHPWGKNPPYFQTFRRDVSSFRDSFKIADLTPTFRDAVKTTRELGLQYIWIDSICIIQRDHTDDGDFEQEADRMENVFSSAYCVLAASSAQGQSDGFLNEREGSRREFVTFKRKDDPPFFVCRSLDDFNQHVLEGPLNKRGWVMQERVLAHRTIYFTKQQTYWECGEGVRCETLTKMENKLASFLGDPNFPEKITSKLTSRGEKIIFYEDLYKQYSRLAFTRWEDRPIAIAGLERRLIYDLQTQGGFGVFDDGQSLLRRSLLWQRGKDEPTLRKITFPPERNTTVPSWSWMAYEGGIDFLELPLGGVEWQEDKIHSPWNPDPAENQTTDQTGSIELSAIARGFNLQGARTQEVLIIYDIPKTEGGSLKCIVMGRRREEGKREDARHYVLFITPKGGWYERVGVGFMPGKFIDLNALRSAKLVKVR